MSFSGGKDSTAMLLRLIEEKRPIDSIMFCDTTKEFPDMYEHIKKVEQYIGRKIDMLVPDKSFEYYLLEHKVDRKPEPLSRWCTARFKRRQLADYYRKLRDKYNIIEYIGYAADEQRRLERKVAQRDNVIFPLVEWGMTEADCLKYCKDRGFDWGGLYDHFKRVSCWCCPMQTLDDLRALRNYYPELWEKLIELDSKTWRNFRPECTMDELQKRFDYEDLCVANGKPTKGKAFFVDMKNYIRGGGS